MQKEKEEALQILQTTVQKSKTQRDEKAPKEHQAATPNPKIQQQSPLPNLPAEIRMTIYAYVLHDTYVAAPCHLNQPALLRTCLQIEQEAAQHLAKINRFELDINEVPSEQLFGSSWFKDPYDPQLMQLSAMTLKLGRNPYTTHMTITTKGYKLVSAKLQPSFYLKIGSINSWSNTFAS